MEDAKTEETKSEEKKPENIKIRDITDEGAAKTKELRYTKRFLMDWIDEDGVKHSGEFVIKRPNIGEQARIGVIAAELREDKPVTSLDRSTHNLHEWIATCQVVVTQAPDWFKPTEMFDVEPVQRVYLEALAFHSSFRKGSLVK